MSMHTHTGSPASNRTFEHHASVSLPEQDSVTGFKISSLHQIIKVYWQLCLKKLEARKCDILTSLRKVGVIHQQKFQSNPIFLLTW